MNILLVDDEPEILLLYPEMLNQGYVWHIASNHKTAIEILNTVKIDVAVIDSLGTKGLLVAEEAFKLGVKTICHTGGSVISESSFFDATVMKPCGDLENCLKILKGE
jgi:DNA-binding NtrC family response regulator